MPKLTQGLHCDDVSEPSEVSLRAREKEEQQASSLEHRRAIGCTITAMPLLCTAIPCQRSIEVQSPLLYTKDTGPFEVSAASTTKILNYDNNQNEHWQASFP